MIVDCALERHLRRRAIANRLDEVAVYRLVTADVAIAGEEEPGQTPAAREHEYAVRFERDDAITPIQLRQAQPAQQGGDLARVVNRSRGAVVVLESHHHAFRPDIAAAVPI